MEKYWLLIVKNLELLIQLFQRMDENRPFGEKKSVNQSAQPAENQLLTSKEVQQYFGIVPSTYHRWVKQKILKPKIMGRKHFYLLKDLKKLMDSRKYRERG